MNERFVNRKTRIGIDNLIPFFNQCQHRKENNGLAPRYNDNLAGIDLDSPAAARVFRDGLAQLGKAGGGTVVGPAAVQRFHSGSNDVSGGVEIGLADLQVNDVFALRLERPRLYEHVEG